MRHASFLSLWFVVGVASSIVAMGCSATSAGSAFGNSGGADNQGGSAGSAGQGGGEGGEGGEAGGFIGAGGSGGEGGINFPMDGGMPEPQIPGEVFGHSSGTLYKLEPFSKQVTVVGPFQGCSSVIDLAIDKDSKIIATTFDGLYWIDKTNAKCNLIASGGYPNSLSFVPAGTLDPNEEALVGYQGSNYVRINTTTGAITNIGSIGSGYNSSGDIVSVKGGGTYLTVFGNGCGDCLIQVDPKTGALVKNWGPTGYNSVYGIAFWAGSVYGFTNSGQLFEITFGNGQITVSGEIQIPNAPGDLSFWGAGSTTIAPPEAPPK